MTMDRALEWAELALEKFFDYMPLMLIGAVLFVAICIPVVIVGLLHERHQTYTCVTSYGTFHAINVGMPTRSNPYWSFNDVTTGRKYTGTGPLTCEARQ